MDLYAVTYTDPYEPWGYEVVESKLYRTPGELLTAFNDCYDKFVEERGDYIRVHYRTWGGKRTFEEALVEEFGREYGVGKYTLVDS